MQNNDYIEKKNLRKMKKKPYFSYKKESNENPIDQDSGIDFNLNQQATPQVPQTPSSQETLKDEQKSDSTKQNKKSNSQDANNFWKSSYNSQQQSQRQSDSNNQSNTQSNFKKSSKFNKKNNSKRFPFFQDFNEWNKMFNFYNKFNDTLFNHNNDLNGNLFKFNVFSKGYENFVYKFMEINNLLINKKEKIYEFNQEMKKKLLNIHDKYIKQILSKIFNHFNIVNCDDYNYGNYYKNNKYGSFNHYKINIPSGKYCKNLINFYDKLIGNDYFNCKENNNFNGSFYNKNYYKNYYKTNYCKKNDYTNHYNNLYDNFLNTLNPFSYNTFNPFSNKYYENKNGNNKNSYNKNSHNKNNSYYNSCTNNKNSFNNDIKSDLNNNQQQKLYLKETYEFHKDVINLQIKKYLKKLNIKSAYDKCFDDMPSVFDIFHKSMEMINKIQNNIFQEHYPNYFMKYSNKFPQFPCFFPKDSEKFINSSNFFGNNFADAFFKPKPKYDENHYKYCDDAENSCDNFNNIFTNNMNTISNLYQDLLKSYNIAFYNKKMGDNDDPKYYNSKNYNDSSSSSYYNSTTSKDNTTKNNESTNADEKKKESFFNDLSRIFLNDTHELVLDFIKDTYEIYSTSIIELYKSIDDNEVDYLTKQIAVFFLKQHLYAFSPSNFLFLNKDVLKKMIQTKGENFKKGMEFFHKDLQKGYMNSVLTENFKIGKDVANTKGKVIFQNHIIELIQYEPRTEKTHKTPILFIPPFVNKYYILDLDEKNSMVKWALENEYTVFLISWVSANKTHANIGLEDYMKDGIILALEKIYERTGEKDVHGVGYCVGGTLLGIASSYMNQKNKIAEFLNGVKFKTLTFLTACFDFSKSGEMKIYTQEPFKSLIHKEIEETGILHWKNLSQTFNMLKSKETIWKDYVNSYMMGNFPSSTSLSIWNTQPISVPGALQLFIIDKLYNENVLKTPGKIIIDGIKISMQEINQPIYMFGTTKDHLIPIESIFDSVKCLFSKNLEQMNKQIRLIIGNSGHVMGVINPPYKNKYGYFSHELIESNDWKKWLNGAKFFQGSWWTDWNQWLHSNINEEKVDARKIGKYVKDAPGDFIKIDD